MKKALSVFLSALLVLAPILFSPAPLQAQSPLAKVAGVTYASAYSNWRVTIVSAPTATGAGSITVTPGVPSNPDGSQVNQAFVNAAGTGFTSLIVGLGSANQETVTPTAVSGCNSASSVSPASCTITATFANTHGPGDLVVSGDAGAQEALNNTPGGGTVVIDGRGAYGSITAAQIAALVPQSNAAIEDFRGPIPQWYTPQPSVLTAISAPSTPTSSTIASGTATGTWAANASSNFCIAYVDLAGNFSPCSSLYNFTPTANVVINFTSPAAATGAVGWVAFGGISSTAVYQLPATSNCTLTTLETVVPACAIGANAVIAGPTTTTGLFPTYTVATYNQHPKSSTVFTFQPSSRVSACVAQPNYGPFTATSGGTTTQVQVLGSVPLYSGCLNYIGRTIKVTGKIAMTNGTAETPQYLIALGPTYSTGTPKTICTITDTTALTAAANSVAFSCMLTVNATGATGTVMPDGFALTQLQAGTTAGAAAVESATAAITSESLTGQDTLYVIYIGTGGTSTAAQLMDLHIEDL